MRRRGVLANVCEVKGEDRTVTQHAGRLPVQVGEEGGEGVGNLLGVGPLQVDSQVIRSDRAHLPRELQQSAENAEGVLGAL